MTTTGNISAAFYRRLSGLKGVTLAFVFAWTVAAPADEAQIVVRTDRDQIYFGESLILDVTLQNVESPSAPSLDAFRDFQVEDMGSQSLDRRSITIINGRRSEVNERGRLYRYRLTPLKSGEQQIPAVTAQVNGTELKSRPFVVNVIAPTEQSDVRLSIASEPSSVYPMQPFVVTLTIDVRSLPDPLADRSPLSVQSRNPVQLSVPWIDNQQIPDGLASDQSWKEILEPIISNSRSADGLLINDIGTQSVFSLFERNRKTLFLPEHNRTTTRDESGEPVDYVRYTLARRFYATQIGRIQIPPSTIKGVFGTSMTEQGLDGENIYAMCQPLDIQVRDAPLEGRPDSYNGGIGTFTVSAELAPRQAAVGEPITLTVRMQGTGTVSDLQAPDLSKIEAVEERFRTYPPTEESIPDGGVFTYSLRALDAETQEFPAIPVAWFDYTKEEFVATATDPIPLAITAVQELQDSAIVGTPSGTGSGSRLEANSAGIFANHTNLHDLRALPAAMPFWIGIWATLICGYATISFGIQRSHRLHADPAIMRRRQALRRAQQALGEIDATDGVAADTFSRIVMGIVADHTGQSEAGMTTSDAVSALQNRNVENAVMESTHQFLTDCDAARYGDGGDSMSLQHRAADIVVALHRELSQ